MNQEIKSQLQQLDFLKKKLESFKPFDPQISSYLSNYLDVELTYNSNAIEGSTLSFDETKGILEKGFVYKATNTREVLEVINHRDAMRYIETLKAKPEYVVSTDELLKIHREILKGIHNDNAGQYREVPVYIRTKAGPIKQFPDFKEVPELVSNLLQWLREHAGQYHPVILASESHYRFVSIHPFIDGNGRTARLLMNLILLQNGYPMANVAIKNREAYIDAITEVDQNQNMAKFYEVMIGALKETLELHIETFEKRIIWK